MIAAIGASVVIALSGGDAPTREPVTLDKQFATGAPPQMTCSPSASQLVVDEAQWKAKVGWFKGTFLPALGIRSNEGRPTYDYSCSAPASR